MKSELEVGDDPIGGFMILDDLEGLDKDKITKIKKML